MDSQNRSNIARDFFHDILLDTICCYQMTTR